MNKYDKLIEKLETRLHNLYDEADASRDLIAKYRKQMETTDRFNRDSLEIEISYEMERSAKLSAIAKEIFEILTDEDDTIIKHYKYS